DQARKLVANGLDPSDVKRQERNAHKDRFDVLAQEWAAEQDWAPRTRVREERIIRYLLAEFGSRPVSKITAAHAHEAVKAIAAERGPEAGRRAFYVLDCVMSRALGLGMIPVNPMPGLKKLKPKVSYDQRPALTDPKEFGKLLVAVDHYTGQPVVKLALQFLALTFVRPGELRGAVWSEVEDDLWIIPASRTKMRRDHLVPLAPQALAIMEKAKTITPFPSSKYVFPGLRPGRPLSENTLNMALRSLGYDGDTHVAHGFRASASTLLNEVLGFDQELRDLQLQHFKKGVAGIYDRSRHLEKRQKRMIRWAAYLGELRAEAKGQKDCPQHSGRR